jgi:nucleotide-binding universal stress UspA family protein
MFKKILVPLDGSELSEASLPYVEELSAALGSEVVLLHVHGSGQRQYERMHQMYLDRLAETVRHNITRGRSDGSEARVTTRVETGEAAETICNLVDKNGVDLIVMTAVGVSGLNIGKMLGSVTDHVCRTVPKPVLLIRPKNIPRVDNQGRLINRILIPLDGSEISKLALPVGIELASRLRLGTTLFQMATTVRYYDNGSSSGAYVDYAGINEAEKQRVTTQMTLLEKELKAKGLDAGSIVVSGFDASYEIIELSKKIGADLVVMSTHGRSGLSRWVLGNVTERVLRHGQTPLLLVHARAG